MAGPGFQLFLRRGAVLGFSFFCGAARRRGALAAFPWFQAFSLRAIAALS